MKLWDLSQPIIKLLVQEKIPDTTSCLYCSETLSLEEKNNGIVYIGCNSGDVYIFNTVEKKLLNYKIPFTILFPGKPSHRVTSMAVHPKKMQRVLIGYDSVGILVFSVNKGKDIQRIDFPAIS